MTLDYLIENWPQVLDLALDHLLLSTSAVGAALLLAIPLGILTSRFRPITLPVLGLLGWLYTVPSLAFLAFLIPIPHLGLGRRSAIVMLAMYAQIFLVRNIVAGLRGVNGPTLEAARGIGMTDWQVFYRVRWPLALPVVIAGIRTAFVTTLSLATVSAWINAGGLGTLLFTGINRDNPPQILAGAIAIVALTLLADAVLRLLERETAAATAARAARRI